MIIKKFDGLILNAGYSGLILQKWVFRFSQPFRFCRLLCLPALCMFFGYCSVAQHISDIYSLAESEAKSAKRSIESAGSKGLKTLASTDFDIHHLRCHWQVDPAVNYIRGAITVQFTITRSTDFLVFDMDDQLEVDSVLFRQAKISFSKPGNKTLRISLAAALNAGNRDSLTIFYQGVPGNGNGFGSFTTSTHAGTPVCWTLSEPYGSRDWWPCKNGLDDKADSLDILISTPEQYTGISIGMFQQSSVEAGIKTTHWKHRYPIASYLVALAATNYTTLEDTIQLGQRILPMIQYVYPESVAAFRNSLRFSRRTIRIFHNDFGDYPFINEKYGHTQFSWGGGMEHQANSFMSNSSEYLVVHEAAHQWFGDKITCGSWQDIWLNEGFAGFLTNYTTEKFYPLSLYRTILQEQLTTIVSAPGGSVFVTDTTNVARVFDYRLTYTKSSWILHMLRWKLGDSVFFKGMRNYLKDPAMAYGYAFSKDFISHMENAGGINLTEFFEDWLYGEGYPTYQLAWSSLGDGWIQTDLGQTTSHPSVDFYEMPVPIRFKNASRDTIVVFDHKQKNQRAYLKLGFDPDSAFIDPEIKLISANNTVTRLADNANHSATVVAFPVPVTGDLNLLLKHFKPGTYSLILYSSTGQRLWLNTIPDISGFLMLQVPMTNLPRGVYWLQIQSNNGYRQLKKILK